jgi:hypothetical protein
MGLHALAAAASSIPSMAGHVDYLVQIARPCVDIELAGPTAAPETSRFGGLPFVANSFEWPLHADGEYRFLGQFNFAEFKGSPSALPSTGLLTLFHDYDPDGEIFWGDDGYILGFYAESFANSVLLDSPTAAPPAQQINLTGGIDIPRHIELRDDWPFDGDDLWDVVDALDPATELLLGTRRSPRWHTIPPRAPNGHHC